MTHFLLIHGSWHGAWCWYKIAPRIKDSGHTISVPNLLGRGEHPRWKISISLLSMARALGSKLPTKRKTTIVVHSRYGVLASVLAELFPEKIEQVIYLASYMLSNGESAADAFANDKDSLLRADVKINKFAMVDSLNSCIYREGLYHDCSDDDNMLGNLLLCTEPLRPAIHRLRLSDEAYGRVPRAYIRLTQDRAVSLSAQDGYINTTGADRVESINASHSAYFSQPNHLVNTILKLSRR